MNTLKSCTIFIKNKMNMEYLVGVILISYVGAVVSFTLMKKFYDIYTGED